MNLRRLIVVSDHPAARLIRLIRRALIDFTMPAPRWLIIPCLWLFVSIRSLYYFVARVLICEPIFKAYCKSYGRGVKTGTYIHWIHGSGRIILGDHVTFDGKSSISFSANYLSEPLLHVGSRTYIGHGCTFSIGRSITIGEHCLIASGSKFFEFSGHATDPRDRLANLPTPPDKVRPIELRDNVWIGTDSMIMSGVTIGEGSVVAAGSVVRSDVAPYTIVAGNPAKQVATLNK